MIWKRMMRLITSSMREASDGKCRPAVVLLFSAASPIPGHRLFSEIIPVLLLYKMEDLALLSRLLVTHIESIIQITYVFL